MIEINNEKCSWKLEIVKNKPWDREREIGSERLERVKREGKRNGKEELQRWHVGG